MVGLGFGGALRGFERRVWSVTLYFFSSLLVSVFLLFSFLSFFCLMSSDAEEHNY